MGLIVGIGFTWFIIEMLLWYLIAQFISGWWVFIWFIIAAIIGVSLIRKGFVALKPMALQMQSGGIIDPAARPAEKTLTQSIAMVVAGILLLIPGLISDVLALLVILPAVQRKLKAVTNDYVMKNRAKMMDVVAKKMGGKMVAENPFANQNPFSGSQTQSNHYGKVFKQTTTVDGSAKPIKDSDFNLTKPANDESNH